MEFLYYLTERSLTEALTKGSQRVLNNKTLIPDLGDAIRDDVRAHPQNFPPGSNKTFMKKSDEELAQWFLEQLDRIEAAGYEGTIYARDGAWSEWIVRRYIAGSHNFEDLIGVMNMNMRDWHLLKTRNLLEPTHRDIPKFGSVRDLGKYMSTHYHEKLGPLRDASRSAAINKMGKRAKIVDNDDYTIYTVFNWAGARALGLGTQWCTANSSDATNYNHYSGRAMLFQMYPKDPEQIDKAGRVLGKRTVGPEKYQFDAGSPCFHDIADDPEDREKIKARYPYIYTDLVKGLEANKERLESSMKEMAEDPILIGSKEGKTKVYDIDTEIKKLEKLKNMGYFTDKVRPKKKEAEPEPGQESPAQLPPPEQPPEGNPQMEKIDRDIAAVLESLKKYDNILKESYAPVLGMVTLGAKKAIKEEEEEEEDKEDDDKNLPPWLQKKGKDKEKVDEDTEAEDEDTEAEDSDSEELDEVVRVGKHGKHGFEPAPAKGSSYYAKGERYNAASDIKQNRAANKASIDSKSQSASDRRGVGSSHQDTPGEKGSSRSNTHATNVEESSQPDQDILDWMARFDKLGRL